MTNSPALYEKHFIAKQDERLQLFQRLAAAFPIRSALYPGSFVHVTPAFVFPETCFVDSDRRTPRFFSDPQLLEFVGKRKEYDAMPAIRFHHTDYNAGFDEPEGSFDLLISQYAGFVSRACKRYLRPGGYLLANNSHGDAGLAALDPDFTLVAVVKRRGERFTLSFADLDAYFVPKKKIEITEEALLALGRGLGYTRSPFAYVFQLAGGQAEAETG